MMKIAVLTLCVAAVALAAPAPNEYKLQGTLIEKVHLADGNATICDPVKQYSGYYKLTTGDKHCESTLRLPSDAFSFVMWRTCSLVAVSQALTPPLSHATQS